MKNKNDRYLLRVAIIHHGTIIDEKIFEKGGTVTIGEDLKNTFVLPAENLADKFPLFQWVGGGTYAITLTRDLAGKINIGGEAHPVNEFLDDNPRVTRKGNFHQATLALNDWGLISLGEIGIFFQCFQQEDVIPIASLFDFNPEALGAFIVSLVVQVCFIIFSAVYGGTADDPLDLVDDLRTSSYDVSVDLPVPEDPEEDEDSDKRSEGDEGKFGEPDAEFEKSKVPKRDGQYVKSINPRDIGLNKILRRASFSNLFKRDGQLEQKLAIRMSGTDGTLQIGKGFRGMSDRGTGPGGGGLPGPGSLRAKGNKFGPGGPGMNSRLRNKNRHKVRARITLGSGTQQGFCSTSNIRRVVGRRAGAIRACYEKALQFNDKLQGKIVVRWTIDAEGRVGGTTVQSSTMSSDSVKSCILRRIRFMRFDKPKGGICIIRWPFVFRPAN